MQSVIISVGGPDSRRTCHLYMRDHPALNGSGGGPRDNEESIRDPQKDDDQDISDDTEGDKDSLQKRDNGEENEHEPMFGWSETLEAPSAYPSMTTLGGRLYASGGCSPGRVTCLSRWSSSDRTWTDLAPMAKGRWCHAMVSLGEKLYVVGGYGSPVTMEEYDTRDDNWNTLEHLPFPMKQVRSIVVGNSDLYCFDSTADDSVRRRDEKEEERLTSLCKYDLESNQWTVIKWTSFPVRHPYVLLLRTREIWASACLYVKSIEKLQRTRSSHDILGKSLLADCPVERYVSSACYTHDGVMFLVWNRHVWSCYFDPGDAAFRWTMVEPVPDAMKNASICEVMIMEE